MDGTPKVKSEIIKISRDASKISNDSRKLSRTLGENGTTTQKQRAPRSKQGSRPKSRVSAKGPTQSVQAEQNKSAKQEQRSTRAPKEPRNSQAKQIAVTLVDPNSGVPLRFKSPESGQPSAASNPFGIENADWALTSDGQMDQKYQLVAVFKDLYRFAVQYKRNEANANFRYDLYGAPVTLGMGSTPPSNSWTDEGLNGGQKYPVHTPYAVSNEVDSTYWSPHSEVLYAGTPDGETADARRYFFCNKDDEVSLLLKSPQAGGASKGTLYLDMYTAEGIQESMASFEAAFVADECDLSVAAPISGYYAVSWSVDDFDPDSMTLSGFIFGNGSCFAHLPAPGFNDKAVIVDSSRVLATSVQYQNQASVVDLEGSINGCIAKPGHHWLNYAANPDLILQESGNTPMLLKDGGFLSSRIDDEIELSYKNYSVVTDSALCDCFYPIRAKDTYLVMLCKADQPDGRSGMFKYCLAVEFLTTDSWMNLALAGGTSQEYDEALEIAKSVPRMHENPSHVAEIWDSIKSGIGQAVSVAKDVSSLAGLFL